MLRRGSALLAVLATVALTACFGSTEPATDVRYNAATLNGRGTADDGPALSYFEYWVDGFPGDVQRASFLDPWPAGASGPFSRRIGSLYARTTYRFRLCGRDEDEQQVLCAQTRSFTTPPAPRDEVKGSWAVFADFFSPSGFIDARAGPPGQPPSGSFSYDAGFGTGEFRGFVTCLVVSGERAAVGAVGQFRDESGATQPSTAIATIIENEPAANDQIRVRGTPGSTPPSCATATFPTDGDYVAPNNLVVYDAP